MKNKRISGLKLARNAPSLSHLLFAGDSLIFCKANVGEIKEIKRIPKVYETALGQQINLEKSTALFSKNTNRQV